MYVFVCICDLAWENLAYTSSVSCNQFPTVNYYSNKSSQVLYTHKPYILLHVYVYVYVHIMNHNSGS